MRTQKTARTALVAGIANGNVVVPDGAACQLDGTTVRGDIIVAQTRSS